MKKLKLFLSLLLCLAVNHISATPVASPSDIQEGKIYTISTSNRGSIIWNGTDDKLESTKFSSSILDSSNPNHQFTFIKKEETTDKFYMVNIGADKFVYQSSNRAALTEMTLALFTIKTSGTESYPLMIDAASGNHWNVDNIGYVFIDTWSTKDAGNCYDFEEVGDAEAAYVTELKERIETAKSYTTITYTSTDGQVVTPTVSAFGSANIISNTYSDGKGTIEFDDVVTTFSANCFKYCSTLKTITIPNSVTSIGSSAFYGCSSLASITIPNSVTSIDNSAFEGCTRLASITIPNSVTSIGNRTFIGCSSLTFVTIPNSVTSIGTSAFAACSNLTSITIPNSVKSIGYAAFANCSSLASIKVDAGNSVYDSRNNCNAIIRKSDNALIFGCKNTVIPNSVTSIGGEAFYGCSSLDSITIPNSVTSIGEFAFDGCSSLASITIPNSVTSIGTSAFQHCSSLTSITIPNSVTSIENHTFVNCSSLTFVTIPNSVKSIGYAAFANCSSLTSITIPNSVTSIGERAFYCCSSLSNVYCYAKKTPRTDSNVFDETPSTKTLHVRKGALADYQATSPWSKFSSIVELPLPRQNDEIWYTSTDGQVVTPHSSDGFGANIVSNTYVNGQGIILFDGEVTSIGPTAFRGCSTLTSITIPDSVTSIGTYSFYGCSSLSSITIPDSVMSIGLGAFSDCSSLASIKVETENSVYDSRDNCNAIIRKSDNILISGCKNTVIPNSVTGIGNVAFEGCSGLSSITIPNSVTSIGNGAFYKCSSLASITIPNSVMSIGNGVFTDCSTLTNVYCYAKTTPTTASNAFSNTPSTKTLHVHKSALSAYQSTSPWSEFSAIVELPQQNDEIWYTSTDGQVVTPHSSDVFGANIISNTYVNGLGIIQFDGEVMSIGEYAFSGCSNLSILNLPKSITSIERGAFSGCLNLSSITLPDSLTRIAIRTFRGCSSLSSIILPQTVRSIESLAFYECSALSTIVLPDSLNTIGKGAFEDCSSLTSITIPDSVKCIEEAVFMGCTKLASVVLSKLTTEIKELAFAGCSSLSSLLIPNSVKSIGYNALSDCSSLTSIIIPKSVTYIGNEMLAGCTKLSSISVELDNPVYDSRESCNAIIHTYTNHLICGCKTSIIPNSVVEISEEAFAYCSELSSITIPNSVAKIGDGAFLGCSSLNSIVIPNSVNSIGCSAFSNCDNLTSVSIGSSVQSIGNNAFYRCKCLAEVFCYSETLPTLQGDVFLTRLLENTNLFVPSSALNEYKSTSPWNEFRAVIPIGETITIVDKNNKESTLYPRAYDIFELNDNIKSLAIVNSIPDINLTYTRNFDSKTAGNWQAWYMPFDVDYADMSEEYDVAQIQGVMVDNKGETYVGFLKIDDGTVKAHTPYVVRAKHSGDVVINTTTDLQPTADAKSFYLLSATNKFTFGGVYANSYLSAEYPSYAMSKSGNFAMMGTSVYLRPFRIYMRITDREDNPYAGSDPIFEVKVVVFGDDETSIDEIHNSQFIIHNDESSEIYNLGGQKLQKLQKGINIINGKKVLY